MPDAAETRSKPPSLREDATAVVKRLRDAGHVAYFAGGCVRDLLLDLPPKDYDVATDAPPPRVRELFSNTQAVGAAFGVILVRHRASVIEVATFRSEGVYEDGRRPSSVTFTGAAEDSRRRDFTINGLFLDPLPDPGRAADRIAASAGVARVEHFDFGTVIDHVGGIDDLRARRLRAIGTPAERFAEDYLRLLRAVRFAARFSLEVEPETASAIRAHAHRLPGISPERIAEELRLMLTPPTRAAAWETLCRFGLAEQIYRLEPSGAGDGAAGTPEILRHLAPGEAVPFGLALAAASLANTHRPQAGIDISALLDPAAVRRLADRLRRVLKISNDEKEDLVETLAGAGTLLAEGADRVAKFKRFLARPTARMTRELLSALAKSGIRATRIASVERELKTWEQTEYAPPPLISGDDLTAAGFQPGPKFKRILDQVYDAQLEGRVADREAALGLARDCSQQ